MDPNRILASLDLVSRWTSALSAAIICGAAASAMAADPPPGPPEVRLTVPPPFTSLSVKHYRAGEDILKSPPFRMVATASMTEYLGSFGPRATRQSDSHRWSVRVYATASKKVAAVGAASKGGLEAIVKEGPGLVSPEETPYLVARVRRKQLRWGTTVSFFSQSTQDLGLYVPHNGHLEYEVWGVTADQRFTVIARVSVSHPKLGNWDDSESVRVVRSMDALKRDRDYKLIEKCRPEEFTPSLTAFDQMLDSLRIQ